MKDLFNLIRNPEEEQGRPERPRDVLERLVDRRPVLHVLRGLAGLDELELPREDRETLGVRGR